MAGGIGAAARLEGDDVVTDSKRLEQPALPPILLLGVQPRSGTNFLADLLACHRDLQVPTVSEAHVTTSMDGLFNFVDEAHKKWRRRGGIDPAVERARMLESIGRGVVNYFDQQVPAGVRPILKTPQVEGMERLFELLPDARVVVMTRDGRDVIESQMRSFGWPFEACLQRWARGAAVIKRFKQSPDAERIMWLRYEDVNADPLAHGRRAVEFLGLDPAGFDEAAASSLPVKGSSTLRGDDGKVTWQPLAKDQSFNPVGRWSDWSARRRARFYWVAGPGMVELGYLTAEQIAGLRPRLFAPLYTAMDMGVALLRPLRRRLIGALRLGKSPVIDRPFATKRRAAT